MRLWGAWRLSRLLAYSLTQGPPQQPAVVMGLSLLSPESQAPGGQGSSRQLIAVPLSSSGS